jgi:hypothetical protein
MPRRDHLSADGFVAGIAGTVNVMLYFANCTLNAWALAISALASAIAFGILTFTSL